MTSRWRSPCTGELWRYGWDSLGRATKMLPSAFTISDSSSSRGWAAFSFFLFSFQLFSFLLSFFSSTYCNCLVPGFYSLLSCWSLFSFLYFSFFRTYTTVLYWTRSLLYDSLICLVFLFSLLSFPFFFFGPFTVLSIGLYCLCYLVFIFSLSYIYFLSYFFRACCL